MAPTAIELAAMVAPTATELAGEGERERRLPERLSAEIADAGLYRLCVPESLGGAEAAPAELLGALHELARADGAAAWCVAVCATAGMLAAYLDSDSASEVYGAADGVVGGVFAPSGRADADGERLELAGRWRFASNIDNCDWLMGGCIVFDDGQPRTLAGGRPDVRLALFPANAATVIDTWTVSGLRATGSHDFTVEALELPAARSASLITDSPRERGPLYAFPPFGLLACSIAAVALGIGRAALDDLAELAGAKTPAMSTRTLAERATTQAAAAGAEAELRAARALLDGEVTRAWSEAQAGGAIPRDSRVSLRLAATHAVEASARAVDAVQRLAGGSAIYASSPIERRFRDIHAATQHMLIGPGTWELAGRALLGVELDESQL